MITKFEKYNESIKSLLVGPTKEEVWKNFGYEKGFETPEEFFLYIIDGIKIIKMNKNNKKDEIYFGKNNKIYFKYILNNNSMNVLWVSINIWNILEKIFNLKILVIKSLITDIIEEKLYLKNFIPYETGSF